MTLKSNDPIDFAVMTGLRVKVQDDALRPAFCKGDVAVVNLETKNLETGMAVLVELPDQTRVLRWFLRKLEHGGLRLYTSNPPKGQSSFQVVPAGSRIIGMVLDIDS